MIVDMGKVRSGDTAVFRCGGKGVIKSVSPVATKFNVLFQDGVIESCYSLNGSLYRGSSLFDIVEIIEK